VTAKAVLLTFAIHANERGYTWPGVDYVASTWSMDRKTVRRQIEQLLVRRRIYRTKKRRGSTGQVKVYRLPKVTYESGGKCTRSGTNGSGAKESPKSPPRGCKFPPNNGMMEQRTKNHDKGRAVRNSITGASSNAESGESIFVGSYHNQNQPAQNHVKWAEFAAWCHSKGGQPTEAGFWKWLLSQKPQWRHRVKPTSEETGYTLGSKFFTRERANQIGSENPDLLTKFRRAVRRGSKIEHA
jgi:hypothetical protein